MSRVATSHQEVPFFAAAPEGDVFGIVTRATVVPNGKVVVLLQGGSWIPSPGRNRMWALLARRLAGLGYHAVRLDYHGVGESAGHFENYQLDRPFVDDVAAVVSWLGERAGLREFVLVGTCFGARTALASVGRIPGLAGLALVPPPVRDWAMGEQYVSYPISWYARRALRRRALARLLDRDHRKAYLALAARKLRHALGRRGGRTPRSSLVSPHFLEHMAEAVELEVPMLLVYGERDLFYEDFQRAEAGRLGELLRRAGELVNLQVVEGTVHGFTHGDVQDQVIEVLEDWLGQVSTSPLARRSAGV